MNTNTGFLIVEFDDGLQIIPKMWLNVNEQSCIWPTPFKTKLRINKAIISCEMPQDPSTWECLPIKRLFGTADTYTNALEKLINAEDTSHIDDTGMSSDERKEQRKNRRRTKAKRTWSSSSEYSDNDLCLNEDKENQIKERSKGVVNKIPAFPELRHFVPSNQTINLIDKSMQKSQNVLHKITSANVVTITDPNNTTRTIGANDKREGVIGSIINGEERENFYDENITGIFTTNAGKYRTKNSNTNIEKENVYDNEFKKQQLNKMNKILYKLDIIENRICMLDEKLRFSNNCIEECDFQFPISTLSELQQFEKQLQETKFQDGVINVFKFVGGTTTHALMRNILQKAITNEMAQQFSWAGKKKKRSFKDLNLATMKQTVRASHNYMTGNDIAEYMSKWLAQATLRIHRRRQSTLNEKEDIV